MALLRDIGGEAIKALAVLALVFLSFAHQPVSLASADDSSHWTVADTSYCGSGADGDGAGHAPCHACRVGAIDLPPAPCTAEPAYMAFADAGFVLVDDPDMPQQGYLRGNPRAPPAAV